MKSQEDIINHQHARSTRVLVIVAWLCLLVCGLLAPWYSTWTELFLIGFPAAILPTALAYLLPHSRITRVGVGLSFMVLSALSIHQGHGMIELHFSIFGLLAFLLFYRDWMPIVAAAALIAVHHLSFNYLQAAGLGVFVFQSGPGINLVLIHAAFVVFESVILIYMAVILNKESVQNAELQIVAEHLSVNSGKIDLSFDSLNLKSEFGHRMRQYLTALSSAISKVGSGANIVSHSTREIATGNSSLAQRTEEQSVSMQQRGESIKEIADAVIHSAKYTSQVDLLAGSASTDAKDGHIAIKAAVDAMQEISNASKQIFEIVNAINEISFKTNLLAINASIEAAHAGEQGKGFAVVAEEVRSLAKKSAEAADETKCLIEDTIEKVQNGYTLVNTAGAAFENIATSVEKLSQLTSRISSEGNRQKQSISQVDLSVQQINELTARNNAMVEEVAAASDTLNSETDQLIEAIDIFHLSKTSGQPAI